MPRTPFVCGNWKMFTSSASGRELASALARGVTDDRVRVAVCPPFPYLTAIRDVVKGSRVRLVAQNLYPAKEGAFTGEVSPEMLLDVGCEVAIVGHWPRRELELTARLDRELRVAARQGDHVTGRVPTLQLVSLEHGVPPRAANHSNRAPIPCGPSYVGGSPRAAVSVRTPTSSCSVPTRQCDAGLLAVSK